MCDPNTLRTLLGIGYLHVRVLVDTVLLRVIVMMQLGYFQ